MIEDIEKEFFNDVGEEIARRTSRRKAINSKKKGNRGEREAKDILNERFKGLAVFSRTPMSGAYVGGANREKKDYLTAEQLLRKIEDSHYTELLADDALFKLGDLYEYYIHDPNKAMDCYRKLMRDFPSSLYVNDARNRYRALRGDN